MNFVQTSKPFSVPAWLRTATLTALGVSALFVAPASAGVIYSENFNQIVLGTGAAFTISNQLATNAGYYGTDTNTIFPNFGAGPFTTNNTGWEVNSNTTGAGGADVYAVGYAGSFAWTGATNLAAGAANNGNVSCSGFANCGLLLNDVDGGGITNGASITGLTAGGLNMLTINYASDQTAASSRNFTLDVTINGVMTPLTSASFAGGTPGTSNFVTLVFTSPTTSISAGGIDIQLANTDSANYAPIITDVQIASVAATPEPASALLLLIPAAGLMIRRRYGKK